jgi:hypothetical protein
MDPYYELKGLELKRERELITKLQETRINSQLKADLVSNIEIS